MWKMVFHFHKSVFEPNFWRTFIVFFPKNNETLLFSCNKLQVSCYFKFEERVTWLKMRLPLIPGLKTWNQFQLKRLIIVTFTWTHSDQDCPDDELIDKSDDISRKVRKMLRSKITPWKSVVYDDEAAKAYLLARAPFDYSAVYRAMSEIKNREPEFQPRTIFDFGSGVGTCIWYVCFMYVDTLKLPWKQLCCQISGLPILYLEKWAKFLRSIRVRLWMISRGQFCWKAKPVILYLLVTFSAWIVPQTMMWVQVIRIKMFSIKRLQENFNTKKTPEFYQILFGLWRWFSSELWCCYSPPWQANVVGNALPKFLWTALKANR